MDALLENLSGYETVQFVTMAGFGVICVVAMILRGAKQAKELESADKRFAASQQIELAYANQLRVAQDSAKKGTQKGRDE